MVDFKKLLDDRRRAKLDAEVDLALRPLDLEDTHDVHVLSTSTVPLTSLPDPLAPPLDLPAAECRTATERSSAASPAPPTPVDLWPAPAPLFTYLAGAAGSGKTFAVKQWDDQPQSGLLLCATTGIAAINLGGITINAALGYFDTKSLQESYTNGFLSARLGKLYRAGVRRLVLDEVSMLDGDQLTYLVKGIEEVNGRGYVLDGSDAASGDGDDTGLGLTLVGDFAQLSPVKAPYAFESSEWSRFTEPGHTITLTEIRRQADPAFIEALRAARRGDSAGALAFFGPTLQAETDDRFEGPTLLAKNEAVDRYNWIRLNRLKGADVHFENRRDGKQRTEWGNPDKPPHTWGIPPRLHLKVGALVMILANRREIDPLTGRTGRDFLYVNGDLGELVDADETHHVAHVRLQRTGQTVAVDYVRREVLLPLDSARRAELRAAGAFEQIAEGGKWEIAGWISYMPLRVAYASTVHKCVSVDTAMQTVNRGIVEIQHLRVGDVLPTGIVRGIAASAQPAYRITTAQGYSVIASADHRWLTDRGLQPTSALLVGQDRLQLALGRPSGGADFDEETAYWLGLLVGDGNYTDRDDGTLHFASISDHSLGEVFARGALRLGAARCSWRKDRRGLHTTCRALRNQLEAWGLGYVTAPHKRVPIAIQQAHSGAWAAFLRGLFDTDGSVGRSGVILTTASPRLAEEVQFLLLGLGILSRHHPYPGRKDPYWQVYVPARALAQYKALVGFGLTRKAKRLAETLPNRTLLTLDNFDRVEKVEPLGLALPMIDLEVTAPHLVGFGPFVGHNSQGLSLDRVQVNIRDAFFKTPGMLYVALSRARRAEGLRLVGTEAALVERCTSDPRLKEYL